MLSNSGTIGMAFKIFQIDRRNKMNEDKEDWKEGDECYFECVLGTVSIDEGRVNGVRQNCCEHGGWDLRDRIVRPSDEVKKISKPFKDICDKLLNLYGSLNHPRIMPYVYNHWYQACTGDDPAGELILITKFYDEIANSAILESG